MVGRVERSETRHLVALRSVCRVSARTRLYPTYPFYRTYAVCTRAGVRGIGRWLL